MKTKDGVQKEQIEYLIHILQSDFEPYERKLAVANELFNKHQFGTVLWESFQLIRNPLISADCKCGLLWKHVITDRLKTDLGTRNPLHSGDRPLLWIVESKDIPDEIKVLAMHTFSNGPFYNNFPKNEERDELCVYYAHLFNQITWPNKSSPRIVLLAWNICKKKIEDGLSQFKGYESGPNTPASIAKHSVKNYLDVVFDEFSSDITNDIRNFLSQI